MRGKREDDSFLDDSFLDDSFIDDSLVDDSFVDYIYPRQFIISAKTENRKYQLRFERENPSC